MCPEDELNREAPVAGRKAEQGGLLGDHERAVLREDFLSRLAGDGSAAA